MQFGQDWDSFASTQKPTTFFGKPTKKLPSYSKKAHFKPNAIFV